MTLAVRTVTTLEEYWADRLGASGAFDEAGVTVGSAAEGGVQLFRRGESLVVGAPESFVEPLRRRIGDRTGLDIANRRALEEWFSAFGDVTVFGPAFYGYTDWNAFDPVASNARVLTVADEAAYERLRAAVPDREWEQGGVAFIPDRTVGRFAAGDLVAIADYDVRDGVLAHIAVVTWPNRRSEGHGRAVVSRVTERVLAEGLLPQYRTLDAWPWSVALAAGLGFERFATGSLVSIE